MTPISPVIPGLNVPEVIFAKDQPEYLPLPAVRGDDPSVPVFTRWRLSWRERCRVLWTGDLWLTLLTFGQPLQPVMLDTECPVSASSSHSQSRESR